MMLPAFSTGQKLPFSNSPGHGEPTAFSRQEGSMPLSLLCCVQEAPAASKAKPWQQSSVYKASEGRKVVSPEEQLKQANKVLKWTLAEMETWVQMQDKGGQTFCRRSKDFQRQLEKTCGKPEAQEWNLMKYREMLAHKAAQLEQAEAKGTSLEHRIQQLVKELQCQRQNLEILQCNMEQRLKMKDKQLEQEVFEHQRLCQALERQHQRECSQLRRELQRAKSEVCMLQAQLDRHQSIEMLREAPLEVEESRRQNSEPQGDWQEPSIQGLTCCEQRDSKTPETSEGAACSQDSHMKLRTYYYSDSSQAERKERQQKKNALELQVSVGVQRKSEFNDCEIKSRSEEAAVSASVSEINVKLAKNVSRHCDIAEPEKKCQNFGMYVDMKELSLEDALVGGKGDRSSWTGVSKLEKSVQNSPEQLTLHVLQHKAAGLMAEKMVLPSELLDRRLKPDSSVAGLDSENSWEQKQATDRHSGEAKDLKMQELVQEGKLSNCVMELKRVRNREVMHQETSKDLREECPRLSKLLWGKETVISQVGMVEQTLEKKLDQELVRQSKPLNIQDLEKTKGKKVADTPEKPHLLESKALLFQKDQGENEESGNVMGHQDYEIHVLCEKLFGLEKQLKTENNHHNMISDEPGSSGNQVCTEEPVQRETLCAENIQDERATKLQRSMGRLHAAVHLPLMLTVETKSENMEEVLMNFEKELPIVTLNETIAKAHMASMQAENLEIHHQLSCIPSGNSDPHATLEEYAVLSTRNRTSENCNDSKDESSELVTASVNTGYTDRKESLTANHKVTADTGSGAEVCSLQKMVGLGEFRQQKHSDNSEKSQIYIPSGEQPTSDCREESIRGKERRDLKVALKKLLEKILEAEFGALQIAEMDVQTSAQQIQNRAGPTTAILSFLQQLCVMHTWISNSTEGKRWCEQLEIWERRHRGEGEGGTFSSSIPNEMRSQEIMKLLLQGPGAPEEESCRECDKDFSRVHVCDPRTAGSTLGNSWLQCLIGQLQDLDSRDSVPGFQNASEFEKSYRTLKENNMALCNTLAFICREMLQLKGRTGLQKDVQQSETQTDPEEMPAHRQGPRGSTEGQILQAWQWTGDPASIAARILHQRKQMSLAYDDTEYEPYGLPEVVMKGFADIPTGPACPYVLRRGLLGNSVITKAQNVAHNDSSSGV